MGQSHVCMGSSRARLAPSHADFECTYFSQRGAQPSNFCHNGGAVALLFKALPFGGEGPFSSSSVFKNIMWPRHPPTPRPGCPLGLETMPCHVLRLYKTIGDTRHNAKRTSPDKARRRHVQIARDSIAEHRLPQQATIHEEHDGLSNQISPDPKRTQMHQVPYC